ncbi:ABC transporter substrate-binding protein [Lipingzhangella sp. LS1_29]|uniref:ABC transporter substrate-binding protein n=1 Tax=Lipingzhangella rawalii TaxID=2055835 RepID=A0ABU2H9S3_9ACTN|nr:ABC transporter substrate-binding protein [Lipingzhangella rawalii]MDS1272031.1 ABC transporter substrate-binding protein [Lipingzhangella rawalii]
MLPVVLGGCGAGGTGSIVVGSADFPESTLLGHVYAQALEASGVDVDTQFNIGSREIYFDQVEAGELDVFPEYNGGILFELDPEATAAGTEETNAAIEDLLPDGMEILDSADAENKDSLTVTAATAADHGLETIEDLEPVAAELTLGAPAEFEERPQGLAGIADTYGVEFAEFRALETGLIPTALLDGDVQVANLFTTDPAILTHDFTVLEDTENVFGAQNVTPLVNQAGIAEAETGGDDPVRDTLNAVSAELETETLVELNERVIVEEENPDDVASAWLAETGLD